MNQENLTNDLSKELEKDLRVSLPPRPGNGATAKTLLTHAAQIDTVITEMQMTIRILEEAKKRL